MIRFPLVLLAGAVGITSVGVAPPPSLPGPRVRLSAGTGVTPVEYSLPVPDGAVSDRELAAPHHDYPASDLMVPEGTPIFAAHAGVVVTHDGRRCGLGVTVTSPDGYRSVSCHLSVVAVQAESRVRAGDVLGLSGDTGNAIGVPHLHFHLRDRHGRYLCPQPLFRAWSRGIDRAPTDAPAYSGCSFPRGGA